MKEAKIQTQKQNIFRFYLKASKIIVKFVIFTAEEKKDRKKEASSVLSSYDINSPQSVPSLEPVMSIESIQNCVRENIVFKSIFSENRVLKHF